MKKEHCWKFTKCGREPGGSNASELGVCNVSMCQVADGLLGKENNAKKCHYVSRFFNLEHFISDTEESSMPYYLMFQNPKSYAHQEYQYIRSHDED